MLDIRNASLEDIQVIRAMAAAVFPSTYKNILSSDQIDYMMEWMYSEESLRRQMTEENHCYYIAYKEGLPVGYLSIQPDGEDVFHLQKLYLLPALQGMHLGEQCFQYAIAAIKKLHPTPCRMLLNVNRCNKALAFYQKMGMVIDSEGDFPIGNGYYMNDYIMRMDIV